MDLRETGKFIKECRKQKKLTQAELAEKLYLSEKAISKWECGNGFPDSSVILPLCEVLGITANELLSAKRLKNEEYKSSAEENLILLQDKQEKTTRHLFALEYLVVCLASVSFIGFVLMSTFVEISVACKVILIVIGAINFIIGVGFAVGIEKSAGYYECACCHNKYIPLYKAVLFSLHIGRTRYLKCPHCHKRSWSKKVVK